jgi:hypothetical protein
VIYPLHTTRGRCAAVCCRREYLFSVIMELHSVNHLVGTTAKKKVPSSLRRRFWQHIKRFRQHQQSLSSLQPHHHLYPHPTPHFIGPFLDDSPLCFPAVDSVVDLQDSSAATQLRLDHHPVVVAQATTTTKMMPQPLQSRTTTGTAVFPIDASTTNHKPSKATTTTTPRQHRQSLVQRLLSNLSSTCQSTTSSIFFSSYSAADLSLCSPDTTTTTSTTSKKDNHNNNTATPAVRTMMGICSRTSCHHNNDQSEPTNKSYCRTIINNNNSCRNNNNCSRWLKQQQLLLRPRFNSHRLKVSCRTCHGIQSQSSYHRPWRTTPFRPFPTTIITTTLDVTPDGASLLAETLPNMVCIMRVASYKDDERSSSFVTQKHCGDCLTTTRTRATMLMFTKMMTTIRLLIFALVWQDAIPSMAFPKPPCGKPTIQFVTGQVYPSIPIAMCTIGIIEIRCCTTWPKSWSRR